MSQLSNALQLLGQLLNYPESGTLQLVERLVAELQDELSDAAPSMAAFLEFTQQSDHREMEEVFTQTFDIKPDCALEVGWHLFGEEYIRGLFMVRMREELRKYGLPETVELPDHIGHVLNVVAAMPSDEATRFVSACVLPAVKKMNLALADKETPYRHVLSCLESVLVTQWGAAYATASEQNVATGATRSGTDDPLHAFPVMDIGAACDSCTHVPSDAVPHNVVPRESELPWRGGRNDDHKPERPAVDAAGECCSTEACSDASIGAADCQKTATPTPARER